MATITCSLSINATGQSAAAVNAAVAAVPLDTDYATGLYGCGLTSDTTATSGSTVTRTIVLSGPNPNSLAPLAADKINAFASFMKRRIQQTVFAPVLAALVTIT